MSVRRRLILVFGVLAALLLLPAAYAAMRLDELADLAVSGRSRHAAATLALGRFQAGLSELDRYMRLHVAAPDSALEAGAGAAVDSLRQELGRIAEYGFTASTDSLGVALDSLAATTAHLTGLVDEGNLDQATEDFGLLERELDRTEDLLAWVGDRMVERSREDFERARSISASASGATWVALAVAVILAMGVGVWATFTLSRPLRRLRDGMEAVGEGAFASPEDLPYDRTDEIGDLSRRFLWMTGQLAELDRMKSEFAGVATHELKNPIHVIQGYVELLREGLVGGELNEEQKRVLHSVREQITLLTRLVERLLQISRLEAGAYPIRPESEDPRDVLESVGRTFDVLAARRDIEIVVEIDDSTPSPVRLDADLIRNEVLGNLVGNALKYTPDKGDIRLRSWGEQLQGAEAREGAEIVAAARTHPSAPGGDLLVLEVSDSGPGIPPEKAAYVFEKYYQAGEKDRDIGSGLGLAIARETVEAHQGTLELAQIEGRGATFRIRLPVAGPDLAKASEPLDEDR